MVDYDFSTLNDKEFESFAMHTLSKQFGVHIERYKPGKDKGVDGRFFVDKSSEIIFQCKHWIKTDLDALLRYLKNTELDKVRALKPRSYFLVTSKSLSRKDKKRIYDIFQEFMESESSVIGCEDLNDFMTNFPEIQRKYYKLWLHSAEVLSTIFNSAILGRTSATVDRIVEKSKFYAPTTNHEKAVDILESSNSLIVAGEPGSGKSTLAEQICLEYLAKGYELLVVADDLKEAEDAYVPGKRQIFYFDDFLGRNYLQAIERQKDSAVINFIDRVGRSKTKKFILTSRTNVLNQGFALSDFFKNANVERNKHEIRVDQLSKVERAKILYNHIWHGDLTESYQEELFREKRYHLVINHKNFNPRLISFLVRLDRVSSKEPAEYWNYVNSILNNPQDVWQNLFDAQIDDYSRFIVRLVVFNGGKIREDILQQAYDRGIRLLGLKAASQFNTEFTSISRLMVGALLTRSLDVKKVVHYDLFNPSIGDFVVKKLLSIPQLESLLISLRTVESLKTLRDLRSNRIISDSNFAIIIRDILKYMIEGGG
jgi:adenylate kinase family enzyme